MKRTIIQAIFYIGTVLAFVVPLYLLSSAATLTPNLSLSKPAVGESGWGTMLNSNSDIHDGLFGSASGHDHTGVLGEGPKIPLATGVSGTLPVANGGTAGTTAAAARSALGAAASGANTDLTSLKGLTGNAIGIGTATPNVALQIEGTTLAGTSIHSITASNTDNVQFITARARAGTSAVLSGDILGSWSFRGYDGSAYSGSQAIMTVEADQNWTGSAHATEIIFSTTPLNSTTLTPAVTITRNQAVEVVGAVSAGGTITSTANADLGWTVQNAANQPCNTTCTTGACVVGIDTAGGPFLPCGSSLADSCVCAN